MRYDTPTLEWLVTHAIAALLSPLGIVLFIMLVAALLAWHQPLQAWRPTVLALIVLYPLSTQFVSDRLLGWLEPTPRDPAADRNGQAIVVLGGGTYFSAPEYGGDTVSARTLVRLRYAAHLHRTLKKPVLVAGGTPEGGPVPEAELMKQVLERDFNVPTQWVENGSHNTFENAQMSRDQLKSTVQQVYLVTHAWHMPRAKLAFEHAGFAVIPAPTGYTRRFDLTVLDFLPDAVALSDSSQFFRELTGNAWYRLRALTGY
jgi:uncharacterized SAM-binding protein YcdF (DUF218 family)